MAVNPPNRRFDLSPLFEPLEPRLLLDGMPEEQAIELFSVSRPPAPGVYLERESASALNIYHPIAGGGGADVWIRHRWEKDPGVDPNGRDQWLRQGASLGRVAGYTDHPNVPAPGDWTEYATVGNWATGAGPTAHCRCHSGFDPDHAESVYTQIIVPAHTRDVEVTVYRSDASGVIAFEADHGDGRGFVPCDGPDLDVNGEYDAGGSGGDTVLRVLEDLDDGAVPLNLRVVCTGRTTAADDRIFVSSARFYSWANAYPGTDQGDDWRFYDGAPVLHPSTDDYAVSAKRADQDPPYVWIGGEHRNEECPSPGTFDFGAGDVWPTMADGDVRSGTTLTQTVTSEYWCPAAGARIAELVRTYTFDGSAGTMRRQHTLTFTAPSHVGLVYPIMDSIEGLDETVTRARVGHQYHLVDATGGTEKIGPLAPQTTAQLWVPDTLSIQTDLSAPLKSFIQLGMPKVYFRSDIAWGATLDVNDTDTVDALTTFSATTPTLADQGPTVFIWQARTLTEADRTDLAGNVAKVLGGAVSTDGTVSGTVFTSHKDTTRGVGYTSGVTGYAQVTDPAPGDWMGLITDGATLDDVEVCYATTGLTADAGGAAVAGRLVLRANGAALGGPGTLDVTDSALVVDYHGATPLAAIVEQIRSGFRDGPTGYWDGPGITSSAAAAHAQGLTAVGVIDNSDTELGIGGLTTFGGVAVDETSVLAGYTWWGDANLDGIVDSNDYDRIDNAWLLWTQEGRVPDGGFRWAVGDFNYDGTIDSNDYDKIDNAWLLSEGAPVAAGAGSLAGPDPLPLVAARAHADLTAAAEVALLAAAEPDPQPAEAPGTGLPSLAALATASDDGADEVTTALAAEPANPAASVPWLPPAPDSAAQADVAAGGTLLDPLALPALDVRL